MMETESDSRSSLPIVQSGSHNPAIQSLQFERVVHCLDLWDIGDHKRRALRRNSNGVNAALVHLVAEQAGQLLCVLGGIFDADGQPFLLRSEEHTSELQSPC